MPWVLTLMGVVQRNPVPGVVDDIARWATVLAWRVKDTVKDYVLVLDRFQCGRCDSRRM